MCQKPTVGESTQADSRWRTGRPLVRACFVVGLISMGYCLYDLVWPGHFVGDMYGLEVMVRLVLLVPAGGILLLGMAVAESGRFMGPKVARLAGSLLVILSAMVLVAMSANVVVSRHQDAVRAAYPSLSTAELFRIAREEKDQFAIDALLVRKDPAAVPGLRNILLDENEYGNLRVSAAHALGEIGTDEARAALEAARKGVHDEYLRIAIDYALQTRMGDGRSCSATPSTQP